MEPEAPGGTRELQEITSGGFTWADLDDWVTRGLLGADQAQAIRRHASGAGVEGTPPVRSRGAAEDPRGFNLVSIAYYFGAFLVLLAYTFFVGLQLEALSDAGRTLIAGGSIAALLAIGALMRERGFATGGNLLIFAATGIVPLLVYTLQTWIGLWPEDGEPYRDFYRDIAATWLGMEVVTLLITLAVLWWTRFPLLTLLLAFWSWYLSLDLTRLLSGDPRYDWGAKEQVIFALVGAAMLALGVALWRRLPHEEEYGFWFALMGHLLLLANLSALALDRGGALGVAFLLVYLGVVVVSVWLHSRLFLLFGALGVYGYISYLAFTVFEGAIGFILGLGFVGLTIVLSAVAYQRWARPRLEAWLATRRGHVPA